MTIRELAAMAGVSKGTVSRVLNDQDGVGSQTRSRIRLLIDETGFTPKAAAQQLAHNRTDTLGAAIPSDFGTSGFYWSAVISALTRASAAQGYQLTLYPHDAETSGKGLLRIADAQRVDGFILFGDPLEGTVASGIAARKMPAVVIGNQGNEAIPAVDIDNREGGKQMARWLIEQHCRNILFIAGPKRNSSIQNRVAGFKKEIKGISITDLVHLEYSKESFAVIDECIKKRKYDGIAVSSGDFVPALVQSLLKKGTNCPVAFFDAMGILPLFENSVPNSIIIGQDIDMTAGAAIEMLTGLIEKPEQPEPGNRIIPVNVRYGQDGNEKESK